MTDVKLDVKLDADDKNGESEPYLRDPTHPTCGEKTSFWCCRGITYIVGFISSLCSFFCCCMCCRKTYNVYGDDGISRVFREVWPYTYLLDEAEGKSNELVFDTTIMDTIIPLPKYDCIGLKAYFDKGDRRLLRISVPSQGYTLEPNDSQHWNVAKLFLMQNAHLLIKFAMHAYVHFPLDAVISIFRSSFDDPHNPIIQLIKPHLEFVYAINNNVLRSQGSVLNVNTTSCCYNAQPCDRKNVDKLISWGNTKYRRPFGYIPDPQFQESYDVILKFATTVVKTYLGSGEGKEQKGSSPEDRCTKFCHQLNQYLQYGITEEDMTKPEVLGNIIADFVFKSSLRHSADHQGVLHVPITNQPMAIRLHVRDNSDWKFPCCFYSVVSCCDLFQHHVYDELFVRWRNSCCYDTRLVRTEYGFTDQKLQKESAEYMNQLRAALSQQNIVDPNLVVKSVEW